MVGGVMEMDVLALVDAGERIEYLGFRSWVGPVVVERLSLD